MMLLRGLIRRSTTRFASRLGCSLAVAAIVVVGAAGCTSTSEAPRVPPPPTVVTVLAEKKTLPLVVNPIGTTRASAM